MSFKKVLVAITLLAVGCATSPVVIERVDSEVVDVDRNTAVWAFANVSPSSVTVKVGHSDKNGNHLGYSYGSGVCIQSDGRHSVILTAGHVYHDGCKYTVVLYDGIEVDGVYFGFCETDDLGLIWVDSYIKPVTLASRMPILGSTILSFGNKLNTVLPWCTSGIYCGIKDELYDYVTTPIHPGNSGGGLFHNGELIGVVSRVSVYLARSPMGGVPVPQPNMGYIVPLRRINEYIRLSKPLLIRIDKQPDPVTGKVEYVNEVPTE